MADKLQGTTVLVTGAAGGLGKAIATAYLNEGANVAVCDINEERLEQFREESNSTGRFLAVNTDITDESAVNKLVEATVAKFGRLDIVVSNAGVSDKFDPVGSLSKEHWDRVLNINLTGSFLVFKASVNAMEKQSPPGGTLIQIASIASWYGTAAGVAYTVSKHGVVALVKSTAGFYERKGIYAVGLNIGGMIDTNIQESIKALGGFNMEAFGQSISSTFKPEQAVQLKDVAKYCVFLADRDIAATVNGTMIDFSKNVPRA